MFIGLSEVLSEMDVLCFSKVLSEFDVYRFE